MSSVKTKPKKLIKLDISHGVLPEGHAYERIPKLIPHRFPWPLNDNSVEECFCAYMLNRIPGELRGKFMDELWRVLIPDGKATVIVPYWTSPRAIQDPNSAWPPLCEQSFLYFNRQFREVNQEPNTCKCNFDAVAGHALDPETASRNDDTRSHWIKHYLNVVNDLHVTLTKKL
jgi:hypothetical protein